MKIAKKVATALAAAVLSVGLLGSVAGPAAADSSWGKGVVAPWCAARLADSQHPRC